MDKWRVSELSSWLIGTLSSRSPILVSGGFRGRYDDRSSAIPALELAGPLAPTARILLSTPVVRVPPKDKNDPSPPMAQPASASSFLSDKKEDVAAREKSWWQGWANVLTAAVFIPPRIDPGPLAELLNETRVIRLFCDTNALASGVAEWLLQVLPTRTEVITSAIADKEIMHWADTDKTLYEANSVDQWAKRIRFLLSRRLTEYPPCSTVIDRLSPDQNALMLAQGTAGNGQKSAQGDLLFVELARPLIREQPRQARVVFLTGDANVARTATSALGPDHVVYANPDTERLMHLSGPVLARGFWHPGSALGALSLPPTGRLLWTLLSAFAFLVLEQDGRSWVIAPANAVGHGGPSDWAVPWVSIREIRTSSGLEPTLSIPDPSVSSTPDTRAEPTAQMPDEIVPSLQKIAPAQLPRAEEETDPSTSKAPAGEKTARTGPKAVWLLRPCVGEGTPDVVSSSPRPSPAFFFPFLSTACFGGEEPVTPTGEVARETSRVLVGLGALTRELTPGPRAQEFRSAWNRNDRDWLHAQLVQSHPGYRAVAEALSTHSGNQVALTSREEQFVPLMRALGQAARLANRNHVGDSPLAIEDFDRALERWLPHPGAAIRMEDACKRALVELSITPCRFETALMKLWHEFPQHKVEARTGGEPGRSSPERVVELKNDGTFMFRVVDPSALTLGGGSPVLFLARTR